MELSSMGLPSPSRQVASIIRKEEALRTVTAVVAVIAVSHVTAIGIPVVVCGHGDSSMYSRGRPFSSICDTRVEMCLGCVGVVMAIERNELDSTILGVNAHLYVHFVSR